MPVKLSVTQVRKEIRRNAGNPRDENGGLPSTLLLGQLFHESFSQFFKADEQHRVRSLIAKAEYNEQEWRRVLQNYIYESFIGPKLGREQDRLTEASEQVISFWQAAKAMCGWLTGLLWTARRDLKEPEFGLLVNPEESLSLTIQNEGWSDSVILTGIADLVIRIPGKPYWCVAELKLGRGCKEADLSQAFLYHKILSEREPNSSGIPALLSFKPEMEEYVFTSSEIRDAQEKLEALIGRMAGVLPDHKPETKEESVLSQKYFEQAEQLISIFKEYGNEISLKDEPIPGPSFIRYSIELGKGVKFKAAQNLAQEIHHRLGLSESPDVRLSEGNVIIDIQRPDRQVIRFSQIRNQLPKPDPKIGCFQVPLGVDLNNKLGFADISEPENIHILVAGSTRSGKSEWLRSALAGLILTNTPETLRLVLIDPKRNAFNELKNSHFLLNANALVYPDEQPAKNVLEQLADEMDKRYSLLQNARVDNRDEFVAKTGKMMPRIVCICDEYYDLISRNKDERAELEEQIFRLGAKAGAAGIHLMIATQQPSRKTIKGALDANIPARIAFKMSKPIESTMLLSQKGAENLLGKGDLLFKSIGEPVRLQSPYLSAEERNNIFGNK
jgi:hypothetical protein